MRQLSNESSAQFTEDYAIGRGIPSTPRDSSLWELKRM
jgi:hypothetical protein